MENVDIVHVIGQLDRGGAERQLLLVCSGLQRRGWRQAVVSFNPGDPGENALRRDGVPIYPVARSPLKPWRALRLHRTLRALRPRIVHSWSLHTNGYLAVLRLALDARLVFSLRSDPAHDRHTGMPLRRPRNTLGLCRADCLVANSRVAVQALSSHGVALPSRVRVVGNIVHASGRGDPGAAVPEPRLVAAGALAPIKGYDVLLSALRQVASQGQRFRLQLAGRGPEEGRLRQRAEALGLSESVEFLGVVDDVPALMARGHLVAHPSRSEGLSNTVLEGMAERLPVVATRVGGLPEIVEHGRTGLLVEPGREDELAQALLALLADGWLRERLGAAALATVREKCSESVVLSQYETLYQDLGQASLVAGPAASHGVQHGAGTDIDALREDDREDDCRA